MRRACFFFQFFTLFCLSYAQKPDFKETSVMDTTYKTKIDSLENYLADQIQKYDKRPYYTLQVNKQGCRVLVRVNDLPLWHNFFKDEGESVLLPINDLIPQSGKQTITIEVYPLSHEQTINDKAHVNVKVIYATDRNIPIDEYEVISEYNVPEGLGDKKLPLYKLEGKFRAEVPFTFSKELETAQDLSKIPNIEEKIVKKYKQLSELMEQADGYNFIKERKKSLISSWSYNYFTKKEIESYPESDSEIYNLGIRGREVHPIENYEIVFYHHNRVVVLRDKTYKSTLLKVYYCDEDAFDENGKYTDEETGEVYDCNNREHKSVTDRFIALYIPEGSDELKVW